MLAETMRAGSRPLQDPRAREAHVSKRKMAVGEQSRYEKKNIEVKLQVLCLERRGGDDQDF